MSTVTEQLEPSGPLEAPRDPRTVVAGRYQVDLDAPLGAGGMALVYRGRDLRTRRDVALKTLRLEYRHDPETRARFRREARLMAFLAHPNVVRVYDLNDEGEAPWVVLEYVPGRSLKDLIAERGAFSPGETADVLDQVASALTHLHSGGLVHLDVKPQNLLVTPEGRVKLIDFGLAQHTGAVQEVINGTTFGTAAYLSPEQASGEPVRAATDVYALGCVVYELLTGRPPFQVDVPGSIKNEVIRAHLERAPDPPSRVRPDLGLPRWVDDVVLWALAKDPAARYGGVDTFARVFRAGVEGENVSGLGTTNPLALTDVPRTDAPPQRAPAAASEPAAAGAPVAASAPVVAPAAPSRSPAPVSRVVAPARSAPASRPATPHPRRPATGFEVPERLAALYAVGGRAARRARKVPAALWRLAVAVGAANLLLAVVLLVAQERVPGLLDLDQAAVLRSGGTAEVVLPGLRIRDAAGYGSTELSGAEAGARLAITGRAEVVDESTWWPVRVEQDGERIAGYVWQGGIKPVEEKDLLDRFRGLVGLE